MSTFKLGVPATRSPARRSAISEEQSPQCSTSQLQQDVTYGDCDETALNGGGSLGGMSPSTRGHTMKECEEQLSHLHKENFNLKLRIYFLEERLGHRGQSIPVADTGTWEAELRMEVEALRTEVADKQQLLCHAASAIDLVEKKHREEVESLRAEALAEKRAVEERLQQLQNTSSERCAELQDELTRFAGQCQQQQEELTSLARRCQQQAEQLGSCYQRGKMVNESTQCQHDLGSITGQYEQLQATLRQQDKRMEELVRDLQLKSQHVTEAEQRIKGLEEAICEKEPEIQIKVQELRERDNIIEEKQSKIEQQNRVLVEIQITLAEKQRLIDALNSTIAARDTMVALLEAQLAQAQVASKSAEAKLLDESRELNRVKGENEMLKTQLKRMNRSKEERESPRRRSNIQARDMSPRNKTLIEEAVEGIWSTPPLRVKDESLLLEEKENHWKPNDTREKSKEKSEKFQPLVDYENSNDHKSDTKFSEESYLKLKKEHQRGCEAIQAFISRIKHLSYENEHLKRESKRNEKKLLELELELKEMKDLYNKAKWEARQFEAEATGVPGTAGTLADVKDMTEEENERLWAQLEDKNNKLAQLSLEMERQVQALLTSLKEKESQLSMCEKKLAKSVGDLGIKETYIKELEAKVYQLQNQILSLSDSKPSKEIANISRSLAIELESRNNIIDHLEAGLKQSMLNLHDIFDRQLWDKSTIDNLQECLNIIFKKKEMEIFSLQQQVSFKDLQLRMLGDKVRELGINITLPQSVPNECLPVNITQHLYLQQDDKLPTDGVMGAQPLSLNLACKDDVLTLQQQLFISLNEQNYLRHKVEDLKEKLRNTPERDSDSRAMTTLRSECNKMKEDACAARARKKEATKACRLLAGRLEELAGFLVSLLQHPERLGNLEVKHCRFIKQAVQRSVNLSRHLSMSISQQEENDCSGQTSNLLMQESASNINFDLVSQYLDEVDESGSILNSIPFESCSTSTLDRLCKFNTNEAENVPESHPVSDSLQPTGNTADEQAMIIARLRKQIDTFKLEIKQRDIELHCLMQEHNIMKKSSLLFDSETNADEHSLASMTFYSKCHNGNNHPPETDKVKNPNSTLGKELMVAIGACGDFNIQENFTGHVQLRESEPTSVDLFTQSQFCNASANTGTAGKNSQGSLIANAIALHAHHDTLALSESETWSEPDRQISFARMGLPEESTGLGSSGVTNFRHHHSRTLQDLNGSSESSQETAREMIRTPGKRRSDALDVRRLQARLRSLEQVNEALRTELTILHQMTPVSNPSPTQSPIVVCNRGDYNADNLLDVKIGPTEKTSPASKPEQVDNPVIIPSYLLEQIKHQREKLESSLYHNDFIRRQLEDVFLCANGVETDGRKAFMKIEDATEHFQEMQNRVCVVDAQLKEAEAQVRNLEAQLQEANCLLAESKKQATMVAKVNDMYSDSHQTLSVLQDKVKSLELQLQNKDAELLVKEGIVADLEGKVLMQQTETNKIIQELSDFRQKSEKKLVQAEEKVKEVESTLLKRVNEMENGILLLENKRDFAEKELMEAKMNLKEAQLQKNEANKIIEMMNIEFSSKMHVCEETQKSLELEIEKRKVDCHIEIDRRSKKLEEAEKQLKELHWVCKAEVEKKVRDAERLGNDIEAGLLRKIEIAEKKVKDTEEMSRAREADLRKKVQESEKRFLDQVVALRQQQDEAMLAASQAALEKTRLVNEKLRVEQELRKHEAKEAELMQDYCEAESRHLAIREQLNQQLMMLERQKSDLERRVQDLESANADLKFHLDRLLLLKDGSHHAAYSSQGAASPPSQGYLRPDASTFTRDGSFLPGRSWSSEGQARSPNSSHSALSNLVLQHGFGRQHSDISDYVSEDQEYETIVTQSCSSSYWITTVKGSRSDTCSTPTGMEPPLARNINSPDLGIESDQGRFSSLEANAGQFPPDHGSTKIDHGTELNQSSAIQKYRGGCKEHNCAELEEKNIKLKRELCQTRRTLEETIAQLTAANQRKKNVEQAICKQVQKTRNILRKANGNLQPEHLMLCYDRN